MINCQQAREYMSLQLDEVLDKSLNDQLEEHLHQCEECLEYNSRLEALHLQLINLADISLEESVVDRLISTEQLSQKLTAKPLRKLTSNPFKKKMLPWYGVAVAAIIAISILPSGLLPNSETEIYDQEIATQRIDQNTLNEPRMVKSRENAQKGNLENPQMSIMAAEDTVNPVQVEVKENQLIITKAQKEIYRTSKWSNDLTVQWEMVDENTVNYFLNNENGEQVKAYQINLVTKQEEKIIK